jgi:ubiquinol-cytochrome c reductase cytochrome b subunit
MVLVWQIVTGTILVFYYRTETPFERVQYIMYEVRFGWAVRIFHFNGARLFLFLVYLHILKALIYTSYKLVKV